MTRRRWECKPKLRGDEGDGRVQAAVAPTATPASFFTRHFGQSPCRRRRRCRRGLEPPFAGGEVGGGEAVFHADAGTWENWNLHCRAKAECTPLRIFLGGWWWFWRCRGGGLFTEERTRPHRPPLRRLHSLHSIWQFSGSVLPPSRQGMMWSPSISSMPNSFLHSGHLPC